MNTLTVVVPTYNRPDFVARIVDYLRLTAVKDRVIIADSSPSPQAQEVRAIVEKAATSLPVELLSFDSTTFLGVKVLKVAQQVRTKYMTLWADDDFLNPCLFSEAIEFLESHPEYSCVLGYGLVFPLDETRGELGNVHHYPQRALELDNPADRLWQHYTEHTSTYYSIRRTSELIHIWEAMGKVDADLKGSEFGELLCEALTVVMGKVKKLERLHCVRQFRPSVSQPGTESRRDMVDWIGRVDHGNKYPVFRDLVAAELVSSFAKLGATIELKDAAQFVKRAYGYYVAHELLKVSLEKDPFPLPPDFEPKPAPASYYLSPNYVFSAAFKPVYEAMRGK